MCTPPRSGFSPVHLIGVALSPVLSGLLGAQSIRAVFVTGTVALVVLAVVVRRVMVERDPPVEPAL